MAAKKPGLIRRGINYIKGLFGKKGGGGARPGGARGGKGGRGGGGNI